MASAVGLYGGNLNNSDMHESRGGIVVQAFSAEVGCESDHADIAFFRLFGW